jgi:hypothetical protein
VGARWRRLHRPRTAGAAGTPWYCALTNTTQACRIVETGRSIDRKADAAADAAGATYRTGEQTGRVVVNGVELAGTVAGRAADALEAANRLAQPPRPLGPGECVDSASGRWCAPLAEAPSSTPTTVLVPYCLRLRTGDRWCVR